jgi:hypothetical protein
MGRLVDGKMALAAVWPAKGNESLGAARASDAWTNDEGADDDDNTLAKAERAGSL